jgi:hypothetical protein
MRRAIRNSATSCNPGRDDNPSLQITGGFGLLCLADCRGVGRWNYSRYNTAEQLSLFGDRDPAEVTSA